MPVIEKKFFTKADVQADRDVIYVYGDNEQRQGTGGQAKACRGEPNTIGIRTKRAPKTDPSAYWHDSTYRSNAKMIDEDFKLVFAALQAGKTVVFPTDGFGTGLALLAENAPLTLSIIEGYRNYILKHYKDA